MMSKIKSEFESIQDLEKENSSENAENAEVDLFESSDELTDGQKMALEFIETGKNVFITGGAGTGKSYIVSILKRQYQEEIAEGEFVITSTTGRSAVDIGGRTIHNWAGFQTGEEKGLSLSFTDLWTKFGHYRAVKERWKNVKRLLIDEISILSPNYFRQLDFFARKMKMPQLNDLAPDYIPVSSMPPFGGIQIILMGDFFQLPPVSNKKTDIKFCFQTEEWSKTIGENVICLTVTKRCNNPEFAKLLDRVRWGVHTQEDLNFFLQKQGQHPPPGTVEPTVLYAKCVDVDKENQERIAALQRDADKDIGALPKRWIRIDNSDPVLADEINKLRQKKEVIDAANRRLDNLIKDSKIDVENPLSLPVNARVMLTVNLNTSRRLCNGSIGHIVGYAKVTTSTRGRNNKPQKSNEKPRIILPNTKNEGSNVFEHNGRKLAASEIFVSENRIQSVETYRRFGGAVEYFTEKNVPVVQTFSSKRMIRDDICPIVYFESAKSFLIVGRYTWQGHDVFFLENHQPNAMMFGLSSQTSQVSSRNIPIDVYLNHFPLQLCWALTTHKAQGMSLNPVTLDIQHCFDGQLAYVAISRAVDPDQLYIRSFDMKNIKPYGEVIKFYRKYQDPPQSFLQVNNLLNFK